MPETACLHVQTSGEDAVRVVDLPGHSMRIGRAVYCGLRLTGPDVADEACRVRRQGVGWSLVPTGVKSCVTVDGLPVHGPRSLGYGETFEVGPYRVSLHSSGSPVLSSEHRPGRRSPDAAPATMSPIPGDRPAAHAPWTPARPEASDRWRSTQRETRRWESKWRSAAAKLATAPAPSVGPSTASTSTAFAARTLERPAVQPPAARRRDGLDTVTPPTPLPRRTFATTTRTTYRTPSPSPERPAAVALLAPPETVVTPPERSPFVPVGSALRTSPDTTVRTADPTKRGLDSLEEAAPEANPPETVVPTQRPEVTAAALTFEARLEQFFGGSVKSVISEDPAIEVVEALAVSEAPSPSPAPVEADSPASVDEDEEDRAAEAAAPGRRLGSVRRVAATPLSEGVFEPAAVHEAAVGTGGDAVVERMAGWFERAFGPAGGDWLRPQADEARVIDATFVQKPEPVPVAEAPAERPWGPNHPFVTDTARLGGASNDWEPGRLKEPVGSAGASTANWPTVSDILAAQGVRRAPRPETEPQASAPRTAFRSVTVGTEAPTDPHEPACWSVPLWLGWLPAAAASVGLVAVGAGAAWTWSVDGYNAGVVAARLGQDGSGAVLGPNARPLPEGVVVGRTSWWATTAHNLANWAAFLDRTAADAAQTGEARGLIDRAVEASPLEATARFALAHPIPGEPDPGLARGLGQTRDVVALAWSGRQLLTAHKVEAARAAYRAALEMAARSDLARAATPAFLDDAPNRRYALPSEELLATVVRDMASQTAWTYKDWADVVPRGTAAPLAVARVLRETGSADADAALAVALAEADSGAADGVGAEAAVRLAATAEALALKGRWADADDRYRRAIDLMPADVVQRSWWINVADIAVRLNEEPKRLKALEAAKSTDLKDEVTVRAVDLQKASGLGARPVVRTARAPGVRD